MYEVPVPSAAVFHPLNVYPVREYVLAFNTTVAAVPVIEVICVPVPPVPGFKFTV